MILTCPECATRFKINPEAIGSNGRTVRCSQCTATWFVAAEPDVLELQESEDGSLMPAQEEAPNDALDSAALSGSSDIDDHAPDHFPMETDTGFSAIAPHTALRDRAEKKKVRRRLFGVGMIWGVVLFLLGAALLSGYFFRSAIIKQFPQTATIYKALGVEANTAGLNIIDVELKNGKIDGVSTLTVTGIVHNYDRRTRDVPLIKLSFKNESGETINSWVVTPSQSQLGAGSSFKFASSYPNPPVDAVSLITTFTDETQ